MSFGGGWAPPWPPNQHQRPPNDQSWRPYANNQGGGPMRQPQHHPSRPQPQYQNPRNNGWLDVLANPYFSRGVSTQNHMANYERNQMHVFNHPRQPILPTPPVQQRRKPPVEPQMNEYVKQTLMSNAHVPGLRSGLQMRNAMKQRAKHRDRAQEKKINAIQLLVNASVFSERIELRWQKPVQRDDIKYIITIYNKRTNQIDTIEQSAKSLFCELQVTAGEIYKVDVQCKTQNDLIACWSKEMRAEFSYVELRQLLQKCYHFISRGINADPQMHEFRVVYRCKPKVYWDEIHYYCNDVMQKYIKDDNGQPGNLINGKINGLFFSARLLPDLTLPQHSPFGNVRMIVNAYLILNPERHNFYFSDFYCNKNIHYVTIVICVIDSETDRYCRDRLVKLNPLSNPFVKLIPYGGGQWRFFINYTLWVELYYTEDIQLDMGQFAAIVATGAGTSKIGGLPNNKNCNLCNLYPVTRKRKDVITVEEAHSIGSIDSTIATILREDSQVDIEVAEILTFIVDRVEEQSITAEELAEKLDKDLVKSVEEMNRAVAKQKNNIFTSIAKNLSDFVSGFNRRRDALIQEVKKLRGS